MTAPAQPPAERVVARSGMGAWRYAAAEPRGGVVVVGVPASWGGGRAPRNAPPVLMGELAGLVHAGFTLLLPDLAWRFPDADPDALARASRPDADPASVFDLLADPEVIADIGAAKALLPEGARFVVGIGRAGVYARLAACAVLGLDGVVSFGGRIWYSGVSAQRPIQPLDLLPGLGCPLQCHFDEADPEAPAAQVDELERRLAGVSRAWQIFRYPPGPAAAGWAGAPANTAWARTRAFLLHLAAERT